MTPARSTSAISNTDAISGCRRVSIDGLTLETSLGVYAFEKVAKRTVVIDVELWIPLALCTPVNDHLVEVVNYAEFHDMIVRIVSEGHVHLIESLADRLADALVAHVAVTAVHVRVAKMAVFADCRSISIDAQRGF
jgi:7,8-dihydroneopterin aldolase/epimerase/oxygenase